MHAHAHTHTHINSKYTFTQTLTYDSDSNSREESYRSSALPPDFPLPGVFFQADRIIVFAVVVDACADKDSDLFVYVVLMWCCWFMS